jgi:hypothetical protein
LLLLVCAKAGAADVRFTVDAGGADRRNDPITITLPASTQLSPGNYLVADELADSAAYHARVDKSREGFAVSWIEPGLSAGQHKTYQFVPDNSGAAEFSFSAPSDDHRDLIFDKTPLLRDMLKYDPADRENTYKVYTHVLDFHDPAKFITKGPGGKYPHHRGIFFGTKVWDKESNTLLGDWWHCTKDISQRFDKYLPDREFVGPVAAREAFTVNWCDKDGKPIVCDTRQYTTWRISSTEYVLDAELAVETLTGKPITLGGDAHHAGFHFRASQEVAEVKNDAGKESGTTYTRPPTAKLTKDDIYADCPWTNASFEANGHHYEVTHMDGPGNPTPTTYSTRPYGRVGAFFTADVTPDKPLHLNYRLVIREGESPSPEELARAYKSYLTPAKASP